MEEIWQFVRVMILAIPVAWASWTVTREEIFRELREYCTDRSRRCNTLLRRKLYYLFTCEYCFSHWCALFFDLFFRAQLIFDDWRGYVVGYICLVWIANIYMNLYHRVRVDIRRERAIADRTERELNGRHDRPLTVSEVS
ncbi:MAG: hypothetical protein ACJ8C4_02080 [Gemmataceae bacterium]